jgi:hypothetical protein
MWRSFRDITEPGARTSGLKYAEFSLVQLQSGEDVATCPSCSLMVRVIYDLDTFATMQTVHVKNKVVA